MGSIASWLLRVYRFYLAQFFTFRLLRVLIVAGYQNAYRLQSRLINCVQSGVYRFLALNDCSKSIYRKKIIFDRVETIVIPPPEFIGYFSEIAQKNNPMIEIDSPLLGVYEFPVAMVVGGVDFLFIKGIAIHHDQFVPEQHHCPAENTGVASINREKKELRLYLRKRAKCLKKAVTLIGQYSGNYAHWLTETLPKLAVLDVCGKFSDWPLLVDDGLHPNMYASIDFINSNCREIIKVERWGSVLSDNLVTVSQPGYERYVPHDISSSVAPTYINTFSRVALRLLRDTVIRRLGGLRQSIITRRVYLARSKKSNNLRQIDNLSEVEKAISNYNIQFIRSEVVEFRKQVISCVGAEVIIAPVGASLANMIFAPPGCKIIALSPYYDEARFFFYTNLAGVLGHELYYVLGPQTRKNLHPIHRSYYIDVDIFVDTLNQVVGHGSSN